MPDCETKISLQTDYNFDIHIDVPLYVAVKKNQQVNSSHHTNNRNLKKFVDKKNNSKLLVTK